MLAVKDSLPSVEEIASQAEFPLEKWPGQCFDVVAAVLESSIIEGEPRFGHYYGPVEEGSVFDPRQPLHQHAWIQISVSGRDGQAGADRIVDPTRWAFRSNRAEEAFLYVTEADDPEYDESGSALRMLKTDPCPAFSESKRPDTFNLEGLSGKAARHVRMITRREEGPLSIEELMWTANLPINLLKPYEEEILRWISELGFKAFIPADHQALVLGDGYMDLANSS